MASSGNGIPVSGATMLSTTQASQLLQKLRSIQTTSGGQPQTIKIQAISTNPQTGAKQIVAIPIHSGTATGDSQISLTSAHVTVPTSKVSFSPMKVIKFPAGVTSLGATGGSPIIVQGGTDFSGHPGVKVVKISAASTPQGITTITGQQRTMANTQVATQILTPSKQSNSNYGTPLLDSAGTRKRSDIDFDAFSDAKRRKTDKGGKGLRHFSMKVCEKVQAKGSTSYNEVADELVNELTDPRCTSPTDQQYDQKNIRRRVYDALNVLMAMNIISKEKKEIRWLGLPTNSVQEANSLEEDKAKRIERIKAKTQQLQDLILQQIAFKNLVERNKDEEKQLNGPPAPNSAIQLPFIIVNTSKKTVIDCRISHDKMEYLFNFDNTFEIHDDMEVLKRMGLGFGLEKGDVTPDDLSKARQMVPRALEQYVVQLAENGPGSNAGMPQVSDPVILRGGTPVETGQSDPETDSDVEIGTE